MVYKSVHKIWKNKDVMVNQGVSKVWETRDVMLYKPIYKVWGVQKDAQRLREQEWNSVHIFSTNHIIARNV